MSRTSPAPVGFFGRMRIRAKTMLGFGSILVLLLVISGFALFEFTQVLDQFHLFQRQVEEADNVTDLDAEVRQMREYARDFLDSGDESFALQAEESAVRIAGDLQEAITATEQAEHRALVESITIHFVNYQQHLQKVTQLRRKQVALIDQTLEPLGAELTDSLKKLLAESVQAENRFGMILTQTALQHLMEVRLNAHRVIALGDEAAHKLARSALSKMTEAMTALDVVTRNQPFRPIYEQMNGKEQTYFEAYKEIAALAREIHQLVTVEMKEEGDLFATEADKIRALVAEKEAVVKATTEKTLQASLRIIAVLALASLAVGLVLAWLLGRGISSGILSIASVMKELAQGKHDVEIPFLNHQDEVGEMAQALNIFKETSLEAERLAAARDEERKVRERRADDLGKLVSEFSSSVGEIVGSVSSGATELRANAESLSRIADETNQKCLTVSSASEEASNNVQTVASAAEELTSSIGEINRQISATTEAAQRAVEEVQQTNQTVEQLNNAANQIGDVVKLIQDIAEQTNLLALNATIEAARAGEAGKGFAVVANEVKSLANQTASATEEISQQIEQIQEVTGNAVAAIGKIGQRVDQISNSTSAVATASEQQASATGEISRNVQQASTGTRDVSENIGNVSTAAGETGAMSEDVLSASEELSRHAENLRRLVDEFIAKVKAA